MLSLFEDITYELTDYEKDTLLPLFIAGLRVRLGFEKAVTNKEIVISLTQKAYKVTDARVRKIINYIRNNNLIEGLIASSKGYYISKNRAEVADYIESLVGRERAIRSIRKCMEQYLAHLPF